MALLKKLNDFKGGELERVCHEMREIFFLSSSVQSFESTEKKERFFNRWLGFYLKHYGETTWCALSEEEGGMVLAYLTVCPNTVEFNDTFKLASLELFTGCYQQYPAHLHMNTHPSARGQGLGAQLVSKAAQELKQMGLSGWHLITGKGERNVTFYERCGFGAIASKDFSGASYLLMGMDLSPCN